MASSLLQSLVLIPNSAGVFFDECFWIEWESLFKPKGHACGAASVVFDKFQDSFSTEITNARISGDAKEPVNKLLVNKT
jgi:hypothetical protein